MLEILSHRYLKKFLRYNCNDWVHIYSFGRIISKCIQTNHNYLINSEIFLTDKWLSAVLISLFLNKENTYLVLSEKEIHLLKKQKLTLLRKFGFNFLLTNDELIFDNHKIFLITLDVLLSRFNDSRFNNQRIMLSNIQNLKEDLKNILKISLSKRDWFQSHKTSENKHLEIDSIYNNLKQKFFLRANPNKKQVYLDNDDIKLLREFFFKNAFLSKKFSKVKKALFASWPCWVKLDYENFEWILILEPVDEILEIKDLINQNNFIFLSAFRKDNFFQKYLKSHNLSIDLAVNFKSDFIEKKIKIYTPLGQMLPNNPLFLESITKQCLKLFIFKDELTVILSNAYDLKIYLATQFASRYGKKVLLEKLPKNNNSILVASYDWWIRNQFSCQLPAQIIIPLLPLPDITDPSNERVISYHAKNSTDWFRNFLMPEAINTLDKAVYPLRKNSGSLVILDGRITSRQWGRELIKKIQPSKVLNSIFPFN
ncbi:MAG: DNA helicase [Prochlorococcus sp. SP3034]|nr:DNA helicase [Prochlorococcus sp. SP3034]|tara:strand:- start:3700 stop:5148 length:1449 start_codon:yes stop_codon:yes gene_type:complete